MTRRPIGNLHLFGRYPPEHKPTLKEKARGGVWYFSYYAFLFAICGVVLAQDAVKRMLGFGADHEGD